VKIRIFPKVLQNSLETSVVHVLLLCQMQLLNPRQIMQNLGKRTFFIIVIEYQNLFL